jgi:hypothetical protein
LMVTPENSERLRQALTDLLLSPSRRIAMSEAAALHARENFSEVMMLDAMEEIFRKVLKN